ncbi:LysE family translocator [Seohaeicola zhoushanensis]|uniref:Lysine transporter LysE n=1 Tax=Seohaeicola zhoushanensis TaxID=1569283 RepID=A0A8J3GU17_9RHOB|nr:LysE family translocator [Seohaeicola zhoushanensis]GHF36658.1 lysine transporter LysE [Seohaeicola zhoushanensis]
MTVTAFELWFYAGALLILFITPGPVWLALIARAVSGGFGAAWPLALGVVTGDILWPLAAILGVSWVVQEVDGAMTVLRWVACAIFVIIGLSLLSDRGHIDENRRLTRPGRLAGLTAGAAVALGNPKSVLFYIGVLPGFFDLTRATPADISVIVAMSALIPLAGNLCLALFVDRMRRFLRSGTAIRRLNQASGILLLIVALIIALA